MKKNADNTFLNTLLDPMSQSFPFSTFARSLTRAIGIQRSFNRFGNGDTFIGTDQDDTIIIDNDLTGGSPKNTTEHQLGGTYINLKAGNDSLLVGGKIAVENDQSILIEQDYIDEDDIEGQNGNKTIIADGIEGKDLAINNNIPIVMEFYNSAENTVHVKNDIISNAVSGTDGNYRSIAYFLDVSLGDQASNAHNVMKVDGSILSNSTRTDIELYGYRNEFIIGKDLIAKNSYTWFQFDGQHNALNISGDIAVSRDSLVKLQLNHSLYDEAITTSSFHANDINVTDGGGLVVSLSAALTNVTLGNLSVGSGSYGSFILTTSSYSPFESAGNILINGDIDVTGCNQVSLGLYSATTFEITGTVSNKSSEDLDISSIKIETSEDNDTLKFDNGFSAAGESSIEVMTDAGDDNVIVSGDISMRNNTKDGGASFDMELEDGDDTFTLNGNIVNVGGDFQLGTGTGNDTVTINGNVSATAGGENIIDCGEGNDTVILNGHINAGALEIDGGAGHDTLILTAANSNEFVSDYKDWLSDLSSTNALANSNIETIRLDVNDLQTSNLGWFTDIINKANANGANIAVEDKDGHAISNVNTYLAQGNDTHNPINDVLDQYAPAAANAAQPKAFADHVAAPSTDAFTAPHFDNNNFLHEMEQQAQVHAAAVA